MINEDCKRAFLGLAFQYWPPRLSAAVKLVLTDVGTTELFGWILNQEIRKRISKLKNRCDYPQVLHKGDLRVAFFVAPNLHQFALPGFPWGVDEESK
jgi:hypothetical protein